MFVTACETFLSWLLEFLSDEFNISVAMIVVSTTCPFFIQFDIFLVPGMMSVWLLEH